MQAHEHLHDRCVNLVPIFQQLTDEQQDRIEQIVHRQQFRPGELIAHANTDQQTLMIVAIGKVQIYQLAANGKEQGLAWLETGDFDGETALFERKQRSTYAQAVSDAEVCQIRQDEFQQILQQFPSISIKLLEVLSNRLTALQLQTTRITTESVETRLGHYLVELGHSSASTAFKLPIKKKDLATYLGTTPETISRKLSVFEEQGLIEKLDHNMLKITDEQTLETLD